MHTHPSRAFTLIELLIVVAIIAILAAIAVPNFLEAQVRSKVARAKTDLRTLALAMESYRIDYNRYPSGNWYHEPFNHLTTPVAYLSSVPVDVFFRDRSEDDLPGIGSTWFWHLDSYIYGRWDLGAAIPWGTWNNRTYAENYRQGKIWFIVSRGPNRIFDGVLNPSILQPPYTLGETEYDPTNGSVSRGDIERFGP